MANSAAPVRNVTQRPWVRPTALLSAVAVGAVTASFGLTVPAAFADQNYPSWDDVQKSKQDEAATTAQIENITSLLGGLQDSAAESATASQMAAEAYLVTQDQLETATLREVSLTGQAAAAQVTADTSKLRAGLIAAHLAKTGAQGLSLNLFLNGNSADDLLQQLGTASKLSEQSDTIYRQALQDKNAAASLADQAASAQEERERLSIESKTRFDVASIAAQATQTALETEQKKSNELYEQLALLKDTTAEAERSYQTGLNAAASAAAFAKAQAAAAVIAAAAGSGPAAPPAYAGNAGAGAGGNAGTAPGTTTGAATGGTTPVVPPVTPPPTVPVAPPAATPPTTTPAAPPAAPPAVVAAPNSGAVATALAFARAQLGDRYQLSGSGPDVWDCSGLTKAAYAAAGIYIGTHSATNQYNTMAAQGRLASFATVQVGDLVFWGSPGNYYHVAIYVGGGQILEAPNPSQPVRVHSIWSPSAVAPYVGRPS